MTDDSYILFNQTPQQLRRIGARGGKATARKRRTRLPSSPPAQPQPGAVQATRTPTVADAAHCGRDNSSLWFGDNSTGASALERLFGESATANLAARLSVQSEPM